MVKHPATSRAVNPDATPRWVNVGCWVAYTVLALMLGLPAIDWLREHSWWWALGVPVSALVIVLLIKRPLLALLLFIGLTQ